mgnify:CR=1 FL=1
MAHAAAKIKGVGDSLAIGTGAGAGSTPVLPVASALHHFFNPCSGALRVTAHEFHDAEASGELVTHCVEVPRSLTDFGVGHEEGFQKVGHGSLLDCPLIIGAWGWSCGCAL